MICCLFAFFEWYSVQVIQCQPSQCLLSYRQNCWCTVRLFDWPRQWLDCWVSHKVSFYTLLVTIGHFDSNLESDLQRLNALHKALKIDYWFKFTLIEAHLIHSIAAAIVDSAAYYQSALMVKWESMLYGRTFVGRITLLINQQVNIDIATGQYK